MTGQETAIEWGLVASNYAEIPERHRLFLRSEAARMYPLLSDDLRVMLGKDFDDFAVRIDRTLQIIQQQPEECVQLGRL